MGSEDVQELEDRWWLGLRGKTLESVDASEFAVALKFGERAELSIGDFAESRVSPDHAVAAVTHGQEVTVRSQTR